MCSVYLHTCQQSSSKRRAPAQMWRSVVFFSLFWCYHCNLLKNNRLSQLCRGHCEFLLTMYPWWTFWCFSLSVIPSSLQPHGLQHTRLPCPSPSPRVCSKPCPLSQWYHRTISSSVIPFSTCPHTFPASGSFPMSQLFPSDGQSIAASSSASIFPMNIQSWFPLGLTGLISLQSKELSSVFSSTPFWCMILCLKNVYGCVFSF